jgi:hypothetical protein
MNKFNILWKAILSVFFVCFMQTYSQAQPPCETPVGLDLITTLSFSGPGFCEYDLSLDADAPLEEGVYCTDWFYGGSLIGSGPLTQTILIECDAEPLELCARVYCCADPASAIEVCEMITAECCADPCDPLTIAPVLINVTTPNVPCELRLEISGASSYCKEWTLDGVLFSSGVDENSFVLTGCEENGIHDICVRVFCCDTGETVWEFCNSYVLACEPCPCDSPTEFQIVSSIDADNCDYTFEIDPALVSSADYCVTWSLDGGPFVSDLTPGDITLSFGCEDNGGHYICARIFCCDNPDVFIESCRDFEVACDCICEPIIDLTLNTSLVSQDCDYMFDADFTFSSGTNPVDYCYQWSLDGINIGGNSNTIPYHMGCEDNGPHILCLDIVCCDTGELLGQECIDFISQCDCPCLPINGVVIAAAETTVECMYSFTANLFGATDPSLYCYEWTLNGLGIGTTATITNTFECDDDNVYQICVVVKCCETGEVVGENCITLTPDCACPCDLPIDFQIASSIDATNCDYAFEINPALISIADYCVTWSLDGGPFASDLTPGDITLSFDCEDNGGHYICARIFCCDNPEVFVDRCVDFFVECDCPCEVPEAITVVYDQQGACDHHFSVDQTLTYPTSNLCIEWRVDGGPWTVSLDGWNFNPTYNCTGNGLIHEVCARVCCCDNPDVFVMDCVEHDSFCECPCPEIGSVAVTAADTAVECMYSFTANLFGATDPSLYCYEWTLNGVGIGTTATVTNTFECDDDTIYQICVVVICCETGEVVGDNCITFTPDCECPCELLGPNEAELIATTDGCVYTFMLHVAGQPLAHPYCWWWIYDDTVYPGGTINADGSLTIDFTGICTEFEIGTKIYCCDDEFPSGNGSFASFDIDCCCDPANLPTGDLIIDEISGSCSYLAEVSFPAGTDTDNLCFNWSLDGVPVFGPTSNLQTFDFDCTQNGWHQICVMYTCCDNPGEPLELCTELYVDCPCTHPFLLLADVTDCRVCLTPIYEGPCPAIVMSYNYGDGSTGTDPCHEYAAPGNYIACITTCCASNIDAAGNPIDSTECETICTQVVIETACCEVPQELILAISKDENCLHFFDIGSMAGTLGSDLCVLWSLDGGPYVSGNSGINLTHQFDCFDEINHEICARVFCCDNPENSIVICEQFEINCPCRLPSSVGFDYTITADCNAVISPYWTDDYCGDVCFELTVDGIVVGDENTTNIPLGVSGVYDICFTAFCCDNPNNRITHCETIEVECGGCVEPTILDWFDYGVTSDDDCYTYTFSNNVDDLANSDEYCYFWCVDGTVIGSTIDLNYTFPADGSYEVCLKVFCCENWELIGQYCETVIIDCDPCPRDCEIDAFWQETVSGNTVNFTDFSIAGPGTVITNWVWAFGDSNTSTLQNPSHTYATAGTYTVCLYVTAVHNDGTVCEDHFCWTVTTECDTECSLDALFDYDYLSDVTCMVQFIDLSAFSGGTSIIAWNWNFGDGNTSTLASPVHTYATSGVYTVTLTVTGWNGSTICTDTYQLQIEVNCDVDPLPCEGNPFFNYKKSGCTAKFYDYSTVLAPGVITNITWDFGDGSLPVSGPSVILHNFPGSGTYTVTVTITIWNGVQFCEFSYQNWITVNCVIIVDSDDPVGIITNDLTVYPNPTSDKVVIDVLGWDVNEIVNLQVTTVTGEVVKTAQFDLSNGPIEVSLEEFETGLYNISVSNNREILISRVVKE